MKRTEAMQMMIESGKSLVDAISADDTPAVVTHAARYLEFYRQLQVWHRQRSVLPSPDDPRLSRTEARVIHLAGEGLDTKGIAQLMGIGSETVKSHLRNARRKRVQR